VKSSNISAPETNLVYQNDFWYTRNDSAVVVERRFEVTPSAGGECPFAAQTGGARMGVRL